jgi:hypothetical protein
VTRILVRPPALEDIPSWQELGWRAEPDPIGLAEEHARFRAALADAGAEVIEARGEPGNLDSIYVYDPVLVTPQGAILLQPGKTGRRGRSVNGRAKVGEDHIRPLHLLQLPPAWWRWLRARGAASLGQKLEAQASCCTVQRVGRLRW